jgi:hypothetical protein
MAKPPAKKPNTGLDPVPLRSQWIPIPASQSGPANRTVKNKDNQDISVMMPDQGWDWRNTLRQNGLTPGSLFPIQAPDRGLMQRETPPSFPLIAPPVENSTTDEERLPEYLSKTYDYPVPPNMIRNPALTPRDFRGDAKRGLIASGVAALLGGLLGGGQGALAGLAAGGQGAMQGSDAREQDRLQNYNAQVQDIQNANQVAAQDYQRQYQQAANRENLGIKKVTALERSIAEKEKRENGIRDDERAMVIMLAQMTPEARQAYLAGNPAILQKYPGAGAFAKIPAKSPDQLKYEAQVKRLQLEIPIHERTMQNPNASIETKQQAGNRLNQIMKALNPSALPINYNFKANDEMTPYQKAEIELRKAVAAQQAATTEAARKNADRTYELALKRFEYEKSKKPGASFRDPVTGLTPSEIFKVNDEIGAMESILKAGGYRKNGVWYTLLPEEKNQMQELVDTKRSRLNPNSPKTKPDVPLGFPVTIPSNGKPLVKNPTGGFIYDTPGKNNATPPPLKVQAGAKGKYGKYKFETVK